MAGLPYDRARFWRARGTRFLVLTVAWIPRMNGRALGGRMVRLCGLGLVALCLGGCVGDASSRPGQPAPAAQRVAAQLDLARAYLERGDSARARQPLLRALQIDPGALEAHVLAGILYERENEVELAERHHRAALAINPDDPQALNNYGAFLYAQGRLEAALAPLRRAVRDTGYPARAQAFENLGLTELGLGRVAAAKLAFQRALDLGGERPRSSLELADIFLAQRDYGAAERHYHDYVAQAGETVRSLCLGLRLAAVEGATRRSAEHAARLYRRYPEAMESCR